MTQEKLGWIVESCHLCGKPARAGTTCHYCGAVNLMPDPGPKEHRIPAGSYPTKCWNCSAALPVFSFECGICGANNTPIIDRIRGTQTMSDNWSNYSLNGCLFESTPKPAPTLQASSTDLPQLIDLRKFCPPVEDQLNTNSCVANAVVGALEFHQLKAGLPLTDISRLFVYYNARSLSDAEGQDTGSFIHHGMAAILAYGGCEARMWPFEQAMVTSKPTEACYENAAHYEAVQYARTPRGVPALTALAQGLPVVFGMFAPQDYYQIAAQTGVMPRPDQVAPQSPPSGHAMLMVGYDLSDKTYLVRNSWGMGWADQGYCKIPFETMDAWARPEDFWTIGAIEQASGLQLSGPSMVDAMKSVGVEAPLADALGKKVDDLRTDLRARLSSDLDAAKRDFRSRLRGK
jgi:C1A family cysteine protease